MSCRLAAPWITALGSGEDVSFPLVRNHVDSCLFCQASIVRQRRLRRSLRELAHAPAIAPTPTGPAPSLPHWTGSGGRPLIVGAVGAVVAVGLGVLGLRRAAAG